MELNLAGKYALICGSSKGIGLATAQVLSGLGATVLLTGRSKPSLELAQKTLKGSSEIYQIDLGYEEERAALLEWIRTQNINIDILINNAGGPPSRPYLECDSNFLQAALNSHLFSMDHLTRSLLPGMISRRFGRIINIVSVTAKVPLKNMMLSNTVRGAVLSWSKTVANEVARHGVTVNNVLPGYTRTQRIIELSISLSEAQGVSPKEIEAQWINQIPMGRLGEPSEIANLVAFLSSYHASFMTGVSIPVDGGWTPSL